MGPEFNGYVHYDDRRELVSFPEALPVAAPINFLCEDVFRITENAVFCLYADAEMVPLKEFSPGITSIQL
jgi:hypothetical protein